MFGALEAGERRLPDQAFVTDAGAVPVDIAELSGQVPMYSEMALQYLDMTIV